MPEINLHVIAPISPVVLLNDHICKAAVIGSIITIGVDSVERAPALRRVLVITMRQRPFSKCAKVVDPFIANRYATTAIILVMRMRWIAATLLHASPYGIKT